MTHCTLTESQVQEAFLAAPPLIAESIIDLTIRHPSWLRDLYEVAEWPRGNGTIMEQLIFKGAMPQIERGFDNWKKLNNNSGCNPCEGPDCSYNWTNFGGNGFDRKIIDLMRREFKSPSYCVAEIQTTAHFQQVFPKVVENLYRQVDFFKEINVGQNILTSLAKKFVVDSDGAKPNRANPYVYPDIGSATIATLNIEMLEFFYEQLRRMPDAIPYDVVNGSPTYSLIASHQLLGRLYRDDPTLRQDVRFSGMANDLLTKYNFMSSIRGMFIAAPVLYPRRFDLDDDGVLVEVLPFINGVPAEVGAYTSFNGAYEAAAYEEVIIHGRNPFKVFYLPTETSLGANTSFGPEFSWFNSWLWINPLTNQDPFRRVGFFATSATLGIAPQYSDGIFGILVARPSKTLMAQYAPVGSCPPASPDCDNTIPAQECPCPLILSVTANPVTDGDYFVSLSVPVDVSPSDTIQLGYDTGGYVTATVVDSSSDGKAIEVTISEDLASCDHFTTIFCDNTLGCSATVDAYSINCSDATRLDLILSYPIKAVSSGTVVLTYGDGSTQNATVISSDMTINKWIVDIGGSAFCDVVGGVVSICVPTATNATCPGCSGVTSTQCAT